MVEFDDDGIANCHRRPPEHPTDALPGTAEKIRILQKRAAQHQWLFYPDDAQDLDDVFSAPVQPPRRG